MQEEQQIKLPGNTNVELYKSGINFEGFLDNTCDRLAIEYFCNKGYVRFKTTVNKKCETIEILLTKPEDPSRDYTTVVSLQVARDLINYLNDYYSSVIKNLTESNTTAYETFKERDKQVTTDFDLYFRQYNECIDKVNDLHDEIHLLHEKIKELEDKAWKYREQRNSAIRELEAYDSRK